MVVTILPVFFFLSGMKKINYFWAYGGQIVHRLSCHHQFCQVIACTLVFLLLQLMQLQQTVALLYSIILGL